jgi:ubiquinone/menaquinone biosynthesis C-methylase UbiE
MKGFLAIIESNSEVIRLYYMGIGRTEQGGDSIIFSSLYKRYWQIGFQTRLYDWLSPEAYLDSLRTTAKFVVLKKGERILDAGCGSGMLLPFLVNSIGAGGKYIGVDLLSAGFHSLRQRAKILGISVSTLQVNLCRMLPVAGNSMTCAIAHFSIYTLPTARDRAGVYRELGRVLRPGGLLVTANPVYSYNSRDIISSSIESLKNQGRPLQIKKLLVYPFTLHLGLNHIERQLKTGFWHGYRPGELEREVEQAGFSIDHAEDVYGGSGRLVVARKT